MQVGATRELDLLFPCPIENVDLNSTSKRHTRQIRIEGLDVLPCASPRAAKVVPDCRAAQTEDGCRRREHPCPLP